MACYLAAGCCRTLLLEEVFPPVTKGIDLFLFDSIQAHRMTDISEATPLRRLSSNNTTANAVFFSDICSTDGSVHFTDDTVNVNNFASRYDPMCSCNGHDNSQMTRDILATLKRNGTISQAIVDAAANAAVGNLSGSLQVECINGCESCYNHTCGIVETYIDFSIKAQSSNFTTANFLASNVSSAVLLSQYPEWNNYSYSQCLTYTQTETGKVCWGYNDTVQGNNFTEFYNSSRPCFVFYNGEMCTSCEIAAGEICVKVDCTNIDSKFKLDTCTQTDFVGPLNFLGGVDSGKITLSPGKCGVSVPTSAPVGSGGVGTVSTPTGNSPVSAPTGNSPVSTPTGGGGKSTTSTAVSVTKGLGATLVTLVILVASQMM